MRKALATAGIGTATLMIGYFFYSPVAAPSKDCGAEANQRWCYIHETERIAADEGVPAALTYVRDVVAPHTEYGTVHLAQHYVGYQAYENTRSVSAALAVLNENGFDPYDFDFSSGFRHGVFERYFEDHGQSTIQDLAYDACKDYDADSLEALPPHERRYIGECYHAVGHATMYVRGNDVKKSLQECTVFPHAWMRQGCYHGVFMENVYLLLDEYRADAKRPDAGPLTPLCLSLSGEQRVECSVFAGWAYYFMHRGDYAGAFAECTNFTGAEAESCISRVGRVFVSTNNDDFPKILATCAEAGQYKSACLIGTAIGLTQLYGSFNNPDLGWHLCGQLGEERTSCENELRTYVGYSPSDSYEGSR